MVEVSLQSIQTSVTRKRETAVYFFVGLFVRHDFYVLSRLLGTYNGRNRRLHGHYSHISMDYFNRFWKQILSLDHIPRIKRNSHQCLNWVYK
jgi:hypothetical protein